MKMFEFQASRLAVAGWHHLVTASAASETGQKAHLSDKKPTASGVVKADPTFALSRRIGQILGMLFLKPGPARMAQTRRMGMQNE